MKQSIFVLLTALLSFSTCIGAQTAIPSGTILPLQLNSSLSLKTQPGKVISAKIMQDVPLPVGAMIRAGTTIVGHVIAATLPANGVNARISFTFDKILVSKRAIPVTTDLRALASFVEVEDAQIPESGPDRGISENAWTTVLVGGDIDYRGGGPVTEGSKIVGRPVFNGVLSQVSSRTGPECRGPIDGNDGPQALWVFSSDACGLYGFPDVAITHAGRGDPIGEIVLSSNEGKINIQSGSGLLLRVISRGEHTIKQ